MKTKPVSAKHIRTLSALVRDLETARTIDEQIRALFLGYVTMKRIEGKLAGRKGAFYN